MASLVVSALIDPVCERVISAALEEYELIRDVKEELNKLRPMVSDIRGVLLDAEQKQVKEVAVLNWLRRLKQVLYDAEDILDDDEAASVINGGTSRSVTGMRAKVWELASCFGRVNKISSRHALAHQLKSIRLRLDDLYKEKLGLGLQVLHGKDWQVHRRSRGQDTSSLLVDKTLIIGRDDEREKIVKRLLESGDGSEPTSSNNNLYVLAITGMGGVGKTTLAQLVFNDPRVIQHFHLQIWICVSEDFDWKRITGEIMDAICGPREQKELCEILNWDSAQRRLKDKIDDKRFLLILDDVWEDDPGKWDILSGPLKYGARGSKIIVTTRKQTVSQMMRAIPFSLGSLSNEDLWPIFKEYAFYGCDSNKHMQLEIVGRQIVDKLKGLPLAAKTIGRLLNRNLDVRHWKHILKSDSFMLEEQSDDIQPVLKLSYDHLSGHLKQCFAYCSLFPKDYLFHKDVLIQYWMAQHFIQFSGTKSNPSECFDDLVDMSFFEQHKNGFHYVMHDLIHDLSESVSTDDCFRLQGDSQANKEVPNTVRHLSIATNNLDPAKLKEYLYTHGNLRTLLFLNRCKFDLKPHLDNLSMKLKRLRVLGLRRCNISELPTSIGTLKHLRLVDLSSSNISKLPESFCNLRKLQVPTKKKKRKRRMRKRGRQKVKPKAVGAANVLGKERRK